MAQLSLLVIMLYFVSKNSKYPQRSNLFIICLSACSYFALDFSALLGNKCTYIYNFTAYFTWTKHNSLAQYNEAAK